MIAALQSWIEQLPAGAVPLISGAVIGLVVVLLIRAGQVWQQRRQLGYSFLDAERRRRRLRLAALLTLTALLGFAALWGWRQLQGPPEPDLSFAEAALTPTPDPLDAVQILIPRLAVEEPVIPAYIVARQWDISGLRGEVAHLQGTAYPGQPGNVVLAGHVTIPGAGFGPFHELSSLVPGDSIYIETRFGNLAYEVREILEVDPTAIEVALPTEDNRLTLITCSGWDDELEEYTRRVVVIATALN